jgi:transposase
MTRRKYTKEFKIEAVRLSEEGDIPMFDVARELGIHPNTLYKWRRRKAMIACSAYNGS